MQLPQGGDKVHLRRHVYANSIDRHVIRKLLHKIFIPCACKKPTESKAEATQSNAQDASIMSDIDAVQQIDWNDEMKSDADGHAGVPAKRKCPGHEVCFSVDETVQELDIPEENIATLLCYLELHDRQYVKTLSKAYIRCKVLAYGGPKALKYVFYPLQMQMVIIQLIVFRSFQFLLLLMAELLLKSARHLQWPSLWTYEKEFHMKHRRLLNFQ